MVRVSRGAGEPSGFLVVVADSGEFIEKSSEAAGRCGAFVITVHQRGRRRKLAEGAVESAQIQRVGDRKSTRLNSSHGYISYAVFCLKKQHHTLHRASPDGLLQ